MNPVAVAIVGCGRMGRERAQHVVAAGGEIAALADGDVARAESLRRDHPKAIAVRSADELPWETLRGIFVCTPPADRLSIVEAAGRASAALFLEKPIAATLDDGRAIRDAARRAGIITSVGYMNRYRSGISYARRLLETSREVLGVACYWAGGRYRVPWWHDRDVSGGPINEQATHLVDLCRYLGGEIRDVQSFGAADETVVSAALAFESGAVGTLWYTCEAPEKTIGFFVFTRRGALQFSGWDFRLVGNTIDGHVDESGLDPFAAEVRGFIKAIATGQREHIRCDVSDAFATQTATDRLLIEIRKE